ncbi:MAG: GGDEF domain-containing protein, partial [Acidimicrobiia bacterium]|nr:GGDEF domain-containing protein [Acidimicrobiia bacterium]
GGGARGVAPPARRSDDVVGTSVTLLVCDLDGFKDINDRHGHRSGDAVLEEVARRFAGVARHEELVCRYGGDEFLVLCESVSVDEALALADRLVGTLATPVEVDGVAHHLGVSIGVATVELSTEVDVDDLVRQADRAMYQAKRAGGAQAALA